MSLYYTDDSVTLYHGDALDVLRELPDASINCCVTSPPYFALRDYGVEGQYGLEASPAEYVERMRVLFGEVRRVLVDDGTLWLNIGSSYKNASPGGRQGATSQRAGRSFTAEGSGGTAARRDAHGSGTPCTEPRDSQGLGSACSGLCDECAAVLSSHTPDNCRLRLGSARLSERKGRDSGHQGYGVAGSAAAALDVPASTSPRSSAPRRGECSHCCNCGACLSVLRSSSRDAQLCVRMAACTSDTEGLSSENHRQGMDALGTAWLNYTERLPEKSLIPIPWLVAIALQDDGWTLRNAVIWAKPNAMPSSVTDRLSNQYETVFLFSKSRRYWFDLDAIKVPLTSSPEEYERAGRSVRTNHALGAVNGAALGARSFASVPDAKNPGDVWTIASQPFAEAHFAVFPVTLAERCIKAGCKPGGTVLDPFSGSGTSGLAATRHGRRYVGIDLNADYLDLSLRTRLAQTVLIDGESA